MRIDIAIEGKGLNEKAAAKQLRLIADMVQKGVVKSDGFNVHYLGTFMFEVDFEDEEHKDYHDGEGSHIHVDEEGIVVFRRIPAKGKKPEELEDLYDQEITIADWAKDHGGITPFVPAEDESGHAH